MVYIPWTGYNPKYQDQKLITKVYKPKPAKMTKDGNHPHPKISKSLKNKFGFKPMAQCLDDFRTRTVSFDLHNIGQGTKMSLLSKLLHRSKSESSMKVPPKKNEKEKEGPSSPSTQSPKQSPGAAPRRRFVRVVRDDQCLGEEYVNPHVTRRFSKNHWEKHYLKKSASLDEAEDSSRPLPYTVTGHTILKKHHSVDCDALCADTNKHAKFNEEVEVLEYDIKGKILAIHSDASILHAKLHDGEFVHDEVVLSRDACDAISVGEVEVELPVPACVTLEVITEATSPTEDDSPDSDVTDTTVVTEGLTTADANTDSDNDAEDLESDSVFNEPTDSEHVPKASRQISAEEECSVKKTKLEGDQVAKSIDSAACKGKLKEVES